MSKKEVEKAFNEICDEADLCAEERSVEDLQVSGEDNHDNALEAVEAKSKEFPELLFEASVDGTSEDSDDQRMVRIRNGETETVMADITFKPFKRILTKKEEEKRRRLQSRNRIDLIGAFEQFCVREINGETCGVLLLATHVTYLTADGCPVIETNWHKVILRDQDLQDKAKKMQRGARVSVTGRIRYRNETHPSGVDVVSAEIIARSVKVIGRPDQLLDPENIDSHQSQKKKKAVSIHPPVCSSSLSG